MSEFKGTKGEWIVTEQLTNNGSFFRIKGESEKVANIVTRDFERAETNAKLIACAPEMLEMLVKINNHIDEGRGVNYMMELMGRKFYTEVDQLIKKATE